MKAGEMNGGRMQDDHNYNSITKSTNLADMHCK